MEDLKDPLFFWGMSEKGVAHFLKEWIKYIWSRIFLKFSSNPFFSEIIRAITYVCLLVANRYDVILVGLLSHAFSA